MIIPCEADQSCHGSEIEVVDFLPARLKAELPKRVTLLLSLSLFSLESPPKVEKKVFKIC